MAKGGDNKNTRLQRKLKSESSLLNVKIKSSKTSNKWKTTGNIVVEVT